MPFSLKTANRINMYIADSTAVTRDSVLVHFGNFELSDRLSGPFNSLTDESQLLRSVNRGASEGPMFRNPSIHLGTSLHS